VSASQEARILRDRLAAALETLDRSSEVASGGSAAVLAQTTTVTLYPTTANAFYAVVAVGVDAIETEGAGATYATESPSVFFAWNAGSQVPPSGTTVICHAVGGRWVFRYDSSS
jgi:hypothetical protein